MATTADETRKGPKVISQGPGKLPFVGNLIEFRLDQLGYLSHLQQRYGDIVTLHLGNRPVVLLAKPEYVHYVLVEHPRNFTNRELTQEDDQTVASEGLLTIDGDKHRQQRRLVLPAFHKKRVESYADIMRQYTQEALQTWQVGETIDMSHAMQELTLRIISKCLFSVDLAHGLREVSATFDQMIGVPIGLLEGLFNKRIDHPLTAYGRRMAAMRKVDMLINTLIAQRRGETADRGDVLSMLLSMEGEQGALSDKQIHDHILTFILAGHETTAIALSWTLYLLSEHPLIREKLLTEIREVVGQRAPTVEDIAKLSYTDWVLKEAMRLYPPAWVQARFTVNDFELDGVRIPAGTILLLSQWVMHRLPAIWGDPESFRPERWSPDSGQQLPPGAYFPFGGGPRTCIGMPLAQLEAKIILVMILQKFIPQTVPGYQPGLNPLITLRPKHNMRMTLLPAATSSVASSWESLLDVSEVNRVGFSNRRGCLTTLLDILGFFRL